ncbi:MAG: hypothetical protein AAFV95_19155 [Bacteroidota bacterium]
MNYSDQNRNHLVSKYFPVTLTRFAYCARSAPWVDVGELNQDFWYHKILLTDEKVEHITEILSTKDGKWYLLRMVDNHFTDHMRREKRQRPYNAELSDAVAQMADASDREYEASNAYNECERDIEGIMRRLSRSETNQEVFRLMLTKAKNDDIADELDIPKESVERRKHKIRKIAKAYFKNK